MLLTEEDEVAAADHLSDAAVILTDVRRVVAAAAA
jgi:hypothetical protein